MRRLTKIVTVPLIAAVLGVGVLTGCEETGGKPSQAAEGDRRQSAYEQMVKNQPALIPEYSNDRDNINFWVETWGQTESEGKLSYVYLLSAAGDFIGYYVLSGLPTTKCKMITPTYDFERHDGGEYDSDFPVPAPGLSGTYGSGAGECSTYYGKDASTGAYVEFTVGNAMAMLTFDQPYPMPEGVEVPALGFTKVK